MFAYSCYLINQAIIVLVDFISYVISPLYTHMDMPIDICVYIYIDLNGTTFINSFPNRPNVLPIASLPQHRLVVNGCAMRVATWGCW